MRFRSMIFIALILTLLLPTSAFAHTGLDSSSPAKDEKVVQKLTQIEMLFKTKIEDLSNFTLKNEKGETLPVSSIDVQDKKMTGKLEAPLPSGSYKIEWKIVGVDGHPITGEYSFSVELPPEPTPSETPVQSDNGLGEATGNNNVKNENGSEVDDKTDVPQTTPSVEESNQEKTTESNSQSPLLFVGLGVCLFVLIGLLFYLFNRKKFK
ncbi:copper resistance CopC family protein [Paenibacillus sp. MMO-177]|uniref:copper resistance CopC family protein n=1 Tax=Paenibacillus sp. MMO-177 TaxID=3081289 RepID=UPI00301A97B2